MLEGRQPPIRIPQGYRRLPRCPSERRGPRRQRGFCGCLLSARERPPCSLFREPGGEDTKTSPRWQCDTHRRSFRYQHSALYPAVRHSAATKYMKVPDAPWMLASGAGCGGRRPVSDGCTRVGSGVGTHLELESKFCTCLTLRMTRAIRQPSRALRRSSGRELNLLDFKGRPYGEGSPGCPRARNGGRTTPRW